MFSSKPPENRSPFTGNFPVAKKNIWSRSRWKPYTQQRQKKHHAVCDHPRPSAIQNPNHIQPDLLTFAGLTINRPPLLPAKGLAAVEKRSHSSSASRANPPTRCPSKVPQLRTVSVRSLGARTGGACESPVVRCFSMFW